MTNHAVAAGAGAAWVLVLGFSLLMLQPASTGSERRVLFFPEVPGIGSPGLRLMGEVRYVPYRAAAGDDLRMLVEETILGPADHRAHRLLPRGARVISAHVEGATAYVNLSRHVLLAPTSVPSTGRERLQGLADTIRFNFPRLQEVRMFIEGQEPRRDTAGGGVTDG